MRPPITPPHSTAPSRLLPRLALGGLVVLGCGAAVIALASGRSVSAAAPSRPPGLAGALSPTGSPETPVPDAKSLEEQTAQLVADCERPLVGGSLDSALKGCARFLDHPTLGGRAHAASSSAYMMMEPSDVKKSAQHAEAATKLGNAAGKYLWAYHGLNGESGVQMEQDNARKVLEDAQAGGMPKASRLLAVLDKVDACLEDSQFRFLEQPTFCLLRPQLDRWLKASGMVARPSRQPWSDEYNPSSVMPDAGTFEVAYDRDPGTGLYFPAAMSYRFGARTDGDLPKRLARSLADKYGPPMLPASAGSMGTWRVHEGIQIDLLREAGGDLRVRYQLPQRVSSALEHAQAVVTQREERRAELTRRAL